MGTDLEVELRHRLTRLDLDVSFSVGHGILALVGPSGAGKSTILRMIAGLVRPDQGRVVHGARVLLDTATGVDVAPEERHVGLVYQDGALFPFMTVAANVAYGARGDRRSKHARARETLERFGIEGLASARPGDLSGGERQRVALARVVASEPAVLLLDEPLSALDAVTRSEVAAELEARLADLGLPTILVSHDYGDVLGLADEVAVLQDGRIVQSGRPAELAEAPESDFVASLAGVNYFVGTASRSDHLTRVRADGWTSAVWSADAVDGTVGVAVYPWDVSLSVAAPQGSALNAIAGVVRRVSLIGNRARVSLDSTPSIVAEVTEESVRNLGLRAGSPIVASWKATATRLVRVHPDER
jgi:molybdate transport system ATP-binding protein